jgi:hypothetical protein
MSDRTPRGPARNDPEDPLVQMNVRVPRSLRDAVDGRRKGKGLSRDVAVERMLRFALKNNPDRARTPRPATVRRPNK